MPNKHFYFAMGALHGTAMVLWAHSRRHSWFEQYRWVRKLYRWDPDWFLYFPVVIAIFGFLALLPDTLYALDILPKSVTRSDLFNVFYGYAWFEQIEDLSPKFDWLANAFGSTALFVLAIGVLLYYERRARKLLSVFCNAHARKEKALKQQSY